VSGPAPGQTGTVTFTSTGSLAAGATASFTVRTTAATTGTAGMVLVDSATVVPAGPDTVAGNNSVSLRTTWNPGAPAGVDIHGQPSNTVVGQAISPAITVAVVDQYGNTVTSNNTQLVTLSISSGTRGAVLGGTTTVRAVNGVATFTNLTLNRAGTYVLKATGGRLDPDFSDPFTVAAADVTASLAIHRGPLNPVLPGGAGLYTQTITITKTTHQALAGPLALELTGLPDGVMLLNAGGMYQGNPYVQVPEVGGVLAPGQSVTITLFFWVPGRRPGAWDGNSYGVPALLGL
jgi:hypothetical protein